MHNHNYDHGKFTFFFAAALAFFFCIGFAGNVSFAGSVYYVGPFGVDDTAQGRGLSAANPWATIDYAVKNVPDDNSTIMVLDGTYEETHINLSRTFTTGLTIKAQNDFQAVLTNTSGKPIIRSYGGANYTIEGFIVGPSNSLTTVHIASASKNFTFRNNIFHDSYNNDFMKINDRNTDILIEGNVFYNRGGSDEDIDINTVNNVTVQDNIFFSDYAGSGRSSPGARGNVVVKSSGCRTDPTLCNNWTKNITIRRNIFLNWEGTVSSNFIRVGEDGIPSFEAQDVLIENNLMLGNTQNKMEAPISINAAKNVTIRANTIYGDLPSKAYIMRLSASGYKTENVNIYNNIWADPTGTMENFVFGAPDNVFSITFNNNVYWNGGNPIPISGQGGIPSGVLELSDDASAIVANPLLPPIGMIILPRYNAAQKAFLSGETTIRGEFERLAKSYAEPRQGSPVTDSADILYMPSEDILGRTRSGAGTAPDIGAYELIGAGSPSADNIPPSVPSGVSASPLSDSEITLSWDASTDESGVSGYKIYRDGAFLTVVASISYRDANLRPATTYTYQVSAVDVYNNESVKSAGISATTEESAPPPSGTFISNVSAKSGKVYEIVHGGLRQGATVYTDRSYYAIIIPQHLVGATYIKTANDDKNYSGNSFLSFNVNQDVIVYIAYDNRAVAKPAWLSAFYNTGEDLETTDTSFTIFKKDFNAGTIMLGGNSADSMYIPIVVLAANAGMVNNITFQVSLEALTPSRFPTKPITIDILDVQTGQSLFKFTQTPDAQGKIIKSSINLFPSTYDILVSSPAYLSNKLTNQILQSNQTVILPTLHAGDLNNDNIVNSLDWSLMNAAWFTSDPTADLNHDGQVNSV
jgi:hypothetical protein